MAIDLKYDMTRKYKLSCHASVHECCCKWLIPPCIDFHELSNRVWLVWLSTASAVQTVPFSQLKMNISLLWACASTVSLILVAYVNESEGSIAGNGANVCSRSQRYSSCFLSQFVLSLCLVQLTCLARVCRSQALHWAIITQQLQAGQPLNYNEVGAL